MSKVLTVVAYRATSDEAALQAYSAAAGPAIAAAGGRVIARGMPLATREAGLHQRVIVIEWDTLEQATSVYETEGYRAALAHLGATAERDIRIVATLD